METTVEKKDGIHANLKFTKSEKTGTYIGFVSQTKTGRFVGVRQNSEYQKKICIVDKKIANTIVPNVLYDSTLSPMKEKNGYIVVEVVPVDFKATIETTYVPKAIYKVEVKFGNKTVLFDPFYGKQESVRTIAGAREILEKRMDVRDLQQVVCDFMEQATALMSRYEKDKMPTARRMA